MTEISYHVPEMHCGACEQSIRSALDGVPGVDHVGVDLDEKRVTVRFDDRRVDAGGIKERIEAAGFDVV